MKNFSSHLKLKLLLGRSTLQLVIKTLLCLRAELSFGYVGWTAGWEITRLPAKDGKMS